MKLVIGHKYYYWNKSVYEDRPSKKTCILLHISRDGKFCEVKRLDLSINQKQVIPTNRLRELDLVQGELL